MRLFKTNDPAITSLIYQDQDIYQKVYTDNADMDGLFKIKPGVDYIAGVNDNGLIGIFELHPRTNSIGVMHGGVLKHQRVYAYEFTAKAIDFCFDLYPALQTIVDETPTAHYGTINFIKKCGFEYVGTIKNAVSIYQDHYDLVIQQYTRK